ncbi:MAG TPA: phosphatase PAP2 family protein [Bacillota bacterium]|nr:phosphatase PAP2 family protein [Bacillota bacterium]
MQRKIRISLFSVLTLLFVVIIYWVYEIRKESTPFLDKWSGEYVEHFAGTFVYDMFWSVTHLGSKFFLIPFTTIVSVILWVLFKDWLVPLFFAGGTLVSHILNLLIKSLVARERPSISVEANAEGYSFPSGHAMIAIVCYGLLMYFLIRVVKNQRVSILLKISFALLIFLIGTSRYIINVHFATDIVTGFTIGFTLLILFIYLFESVDQKRKLSKIQP